MLPYPRKALLAPAAASLLIAFGPAQGETQARSGNSMAFRETIDRSVSLSSGADTSVETVGGPVTIETGGGNVAKIHIVRGGVTARELACYRIDVIGSGNRLAIKHVQFIKRPGCASIHAGQEVRLRLPSSVNLSLEGVGGTVDIAPIEGRLRLSGIAGHVRARGAASADISGLAGGLDLIVGPTTRQVKVSGVVGPTDIKFASGANADVHVDAVMGNTTSTSSRIPIRWRDGRAIARVGKGGSVVSVSGVIGHVTLHGS